MASANECSLQLNEFSDTLSSLQVAFQVLKLRNSVFVWIGNAEDKRLDDLSLAMMLPPNEITSTRLMGNILSPANVLTKRLSKKLNKPVYLSYNLPQTDNMLLEVVTKRLTKEIENHPDKF